ncbi:MAG TPA: hypothetical protein VM308_00015 [Sphingomicrobium sp.]|nr:hypothetical protein [Sphingomicrobium sp.]
MILSHRHRFVFIKGVKVAGTSVEIALSQVCEADDIVTPITPADERHRLGTGGEPRNYARHLFPGWLRRRLERRYVEKIRSASPDALSTIRSPPRRFWNHMELARVLRLVPAARDYEVLGVERSPYSKVLSLANWLANEDRYNRGENLPGSPEAVRSSIDRLIADGRIRSVLNINRYRDLNGVVAVTPWRTESLSEDLAAFFRSKGLDAVPLVHAKKGFQSERLDPRSIMRPDQIAAVNRIFAEEFEQFGWAQL